MTHDKDCEVNKCGHYVNCNNYACEGEHDCTCSEEPTEAEDDESYMFFPPQKEPVEGWVEEFEKKFSPETRRDGVTYDISEEIITFISSLLEAERERILRVLYISPENFASRERDYEIFHQEK